MNYDDWYEDEDYMIDGVGFADPGGRSALRAATIKNPRNLPCPTCGRENALTPLDWAAGSCQRIIAPRYKAIKEAREFAKQNQLFFVIG